MSYEGRSGIFKMWIGTDVGKRANPSPSRATLLRLARTLDVIRGQAGDDREKGGKGRTVTGQDWCQDWCQTQNTSLMSENVHYPIFLEFPNDLCFIAYPPLPLANACLLSGVTEPSITACMRWTMRMVPANSVTDNESVFMVRQTNERQRAREGETREPCAYLTICSLACPDDNVGYSDGHNTNLLGKRLTGHADMRTDEVYKMPLCLYSVYLPTTRMDGEARRGMKRSTIWDRDV